MLCLVRVQAGGGAVGLVAGGEGGGGEGGYVAGEGEEAGAVGGVACLL